MLVPPEMELVDLRYDILLIIVNLVQPEDLDALLATCKRALGVAQRRLPKHKLLKTCNAYYSLTKERPIDLLYRIWEERSIAEYITTLDYTGLDNDEGINRIEDGVGEYMLEHFNDCLDDLLDQVTEDTAIFTDRIFDARCEAPSFGLLIALLPNLTRLKITDPYFDIGILRNIIKQINAANANGDDKAHRRRGYRPLSKLQKIKFRMRPDGSYHHYDVFTIFSDIPSVKVLSGNYIDFSWVLHDPEMSSLDLQRSNIEHLEMSHSCITDYEDEGLFSRFISLMPNLKTFKYSHNGCMTYDDTFYASDILTDLQDANTHSKIQSLTLCGISDCSMSVSGSMKWLSELRHLEIDADIFLRLVEIYFEDDTASMVDCCKITATDDPNHIIALQTPNYHGFVPTAVRDIPSLYYLLPRRLETLTLNTSRLTAKDVNTLLQHLYLHKSLRKIEYAGPRVDGLERFFQHGRIELVHHGQSMPAHDAPGRLQ